MVDHERGALVELGEREEHQFNIEDRAASFFLGCGELRVAFVIVLQFESPPGSAVAVGEGLGGFCGFLDIFVERDQLFGWWFITGAPGLVRNDGHFAILRQGLDIPSAE